MTPRVKHPIEITDRRATDDVERIAQQLAREIQARERLEDRISVLLNDLEATLRDDIAAERLEVRRLRESLQDLASWVRQ